MKKVWFGVGLVLIVVVLAAVYSLKKPVEYLVMGTNAEFPPFEMLGGADNSAVVGFDVDIARAIAAQVDKPLQVVDMAFDQLLPALAEGRVDFVLAGMTITDARAQLVDFSDPYYTSTQVAVIRKGDPLPTSKEDLRDQRVGAPAETTGAAAAAELTHGKRKLLFFDSALATVVGLMNSRVDFALVDEQPAIHLQKRFARDLRVVPLDFDKEHYGVAVQKGSTQLLAQVNAVLGELASDGRMEQFTEQWMVRVPEAAAATEE